MIDNPLVVCRALTSSKNQAGFLFGGIVARHTVGWTKVYRSLDNHWAGEDAISYALFIRLISWANFNDSKRILDGKLATIKRGQLLTSVRELADSFKCDRSTIERRLQAFEQDKMIEREVRRKGTIITICNYEKFQGQDLNSETLNHMRTTLEPTAEPTPIKNIKKNSIIKEGGGENPHPFKIWFDELYMQRVQRPFFWTPNVEHQFLEFCSTISEDDLKIIMRNFFNSRNPFYIERVFEPGLMISDANKLRGIGIEGQTFRKKRTFN